MSPVNLFETRAIIRVVGVGGAGCNAVDRIADYETGVELIALNTDRQALDHSKADHVRIIGEHATRGLGVGGDPKLGETAAIESEREIKALLEGSDMVFLTAGMGGGTGTGAAPVIARLARQLGILTVAVVSKPFDFEGPMRRKLAEEGLNRLAGEVDTLIVIPNQKLFEVAERKISLKDAFQLADAVLQQGVRGISDIILRPGLINVDFADVRSVMANAGRAALGLGVAQGEERARRAAESAIHSPLVDTNLTGAKRLLVNVTASSDLSLGELDDIMSYISQIADPNEASIFMGHTVDDEMGDRVAVTLVAGGLPENQPRPQRDTTVFAAVQNANERRDRQTELNHAVVERTLNQAVETEPARPIENEIREAELAHAAAGTYEDETVNIDIPSFLRKQRNTRLS